MLTNIKEFFKFAAKTGIYFPAAYDQASRGPSVSLFMTHLSSYVAIAAIIYLICNDALAGTISAMIYATLMITFYLMRRLTKAKFDLDDKSIELENNEQDKEKKNV